MSDHSLFIIYYVNLFPHTGLEQIGSGLEGFKFGSSTGGSGFLFETLPKIKAEYVRGTVTGNIPSSSKDNTGKGTVIEDVKYEIYELTY